MSFADMQWLFYQMSESGPMGLLFCFLNPRHPHPITLLPSSFPNDHSKAIPLLEFFFVCASVVSVAVDLSLFVPQLSFFWCLGRAVLRDFDISSVPSHIFL